MDLESQVERLAEARAAVARVVVGQEAAIEQVFISLIAGGHALIEGAPGLGKTLLVRTIAKVCSLKSTRIQFTPDLMPADVTGTVALIHDDRGNALTRFQPGPIFGQLVLADEINRATPKTQSALLEAMQERTVTVAGQEHPLPTPFFVLATQNPIEMEGTYPLPEAQIDRFFFNVHLPFPRAKTLDEILRLTTDVAEPTAEAVIDAAELLALQSIARQVPMASHVRARIVNLTMNTQPEEPTATPEVRRHVRLGLSPRAAQSVVLASKARALLQGRFNVSLQDVEAVLEPALRHRLHLNFEGAAEGVEVETVLAGAWRSAMEAKVAG